MQKEVEAQKLSMTYDHRHELAEAIWSKLLFHTDRIAFVYAEDKLLIHVMFNSPIDLDGADLIVGMLDDWKRYIETPVLKKGKTESQT